MTVLSILIAAALSLLLLATALRSRRKMRVDKQNTGVRTSPREEERKLAVDRRNRERDLPARPGISAQPPSVFASYWEDDDGEDTPTDSDPSASRRLETPTRAMYRRAFVRMMRLDRRLCLTPSEIDERIACATVVNRWARQNAVDTLEVDVRPPTAAQGSRNADRSELADARTAPPPVTAQVSFGQTSVFGLSRSAEDEGFDACPAHRVAFIMANFHLGSLREH